jgi:hypothetical protein
MILSFINFICRLTKLINFILVVHLTEQLEHARSPRLIPSEKVLVCTNIYLLIKLNK